MRRLARLIDKGAARSWIARAVSAPQLIQHQLAAVRQLNRKPVPAALFRLEEAGAELVIHPAFALDFESFAVDADRPAGRHARERVVMRGVAGLRAFLADAIDAVDRRGFARFEDQVDSSLRTGSAQEVAFAPAATGIFAGIEHRGPVVIPDVVLIRFRSGEPGPASGEFLAEAITPAGGVADGEMSHVQIANGPARRIGRRVVDADTEEGDLVAEPAAVCRLHVAGVVPPLDLVVRMTGMIPWKNERVPRCGLFPWRRTL